MKISSLDHLVLTVRSIDATLSWYECVLGMEVARFGEGRVALTFGNQKINLHEHGHEFEPKALQPTPGSADLCFLTDIPLSQVQQHLHQCNIAIECGPISRTGATGFILSVYIRDPDKNLIEISNPLENK